MNFNDKRKVMFGEKAVIDMDIDPAVSNMDTPSDIKVPFFALSNRTATNGAKQNQNTEKKDEKSISVGTENVVK